jgi:hypothetical protein
MGNRRKFGKETLEVNLLGQPCMRETRLMFQAPKNFRALFFSGSCQIGLGFLAHDINQVAHR